VKDEPVRRRIRWITSVNAIRSAAWRDEDVLTGERRKTSAIRHKTLSAVIGVIAEIIPNLLVATRFNLGDVRVSLSQSIVDNTKLKHKISTIVAPVKRVSVRFFKITVFNGCVGSRTAATLLPGDKPIRKVRPIAVKLAILNGCHGIGRKEKYRGHRCRTKATILDQNACQSGRVNLYRGIAHVEILNRDVP
jgi:hypothetical protein